MHLPQPTEGGSFTPPPAGTHPAICYRFVDLGTQTTNFNGDIKTAHKVMLSWEITDQDLRTDDGQPFTISSRYTWSMHEKATLRKTLEGWRGVPFADSDFGPGGFNVQKLLGAGCLLSVLPAERDGKTYSNISAVMKLPKGMSAGVCINPYVYFTLDPEEFDREIFNSFSDKLQDTIKASPQYQALSRPSAPADFVPPNFGDGSEVGMNDIPF